MPCACRVSSLRRQHRVSILLLKQDTAAPSQQPFDTGDQSWPVVQHCTLLRNFVVPVCSWARRVIDRWVGGRVSVGHGSRRKGEREGRVVEKPSPAGRQGVLLASLALSSRGEGRCDPSTPDGCQPWLPPRTRCTNSWSHRSLPG